MNDDGAPGFRPIDIATLVYASIEAILITLFMSNQPGWFFLVGFYLAACGIVLIFALFEKYGFFRILRLFYPVVLAPMFYESIRTQIKMFHQRLFDGQINSIEMAVFGFNPSFAIQNYMTIGLNEVMSIFYMSFYILPFLALFLFLFKRCWDSLERGALAASVAFYICFVIFILYPVSGPRYYLDNIFYLPLIGPIFTPLALTIVDRGGLVGGAMPSSHCAVALVFVWYICKESRILRIPMVLALLLLCLSTVYGRYHYVSDVFVGLLIGSISILLTSRWQDRFLRAKEKAVSAIDIKRDEAVGIGS
jgi:membrane-associated phospholipid phosphatase